MNSKHRYYRYAVLLLMFGLIMGYLYLFRVGEAQHILASIRRMGVAGIVLGVTIQALVNTLPVPGSFISIMLMEIYGPVTGWACSFTGGVAGAVGGLLLARWASRSFFGRWVSPYLDRVEKMIHKRETWGLLVLRYIPFVPYHLLNYAAGLLKVRIWGFIWTTAIGILPYTLAVSGLYTGVRQGSFLWGILGLGGIMMLASIGWLARGRRL